MQVATQEKLSEPEKFVTIRNIQLTRPLDILNSKSSSIYFELVKDNGIFGFDDNIPNIWL